MLRSKRSIFLYVLIFVGFSAIIVRLFDLMVINHERLAKKSAIQTTTELSIEVRRGMILDRLGRRLAVNLEHSSVYLDRLNYTPDEKKLYQMAQIINTDYDDLVRSIKGDKGFVWIKRKIPMEDTVRIEQLKFNGIGLLPEPKRHYATGSLAAHILGFVDIDNRGLEGIEAQYNKDLTKSGGKYSVERDARGNIFYTSNENEITGNSIVLTIDQGLQYIVETELDTAIDKWKASAATAIMLDPYSGEILALANRPTFDPNHPAGVTPSARRNRAITDIYEPGSTFKIVTATGVLEEKLVRPDELIDCQGGSIQVGRKRVKDAHPHGVLTFMEVIQKSSNVGTIKLAQRLGKQRLYDYVRKFGFGEKTGIDLPGEIPGWIRKPEKWSGTSIGAVPIGQEIAATPLQLVTAYSIVANGGYAVYPHIVKAVINPEGKTVKYWSDNKKERLISKHTIGILTEALKMVTQKGGTAKDATVEGNTVAGKTGTAQVFDKSIGRYSSVDYISSFVGFVPADKPAFALIVVVWKPRGQIYGGLVAAPVFKNITEKSLSYLNVPKDDTPTDDKIKKDILVVDKGTVNTAPGISTPWKVN
ncbi:MAG: penicillin-binding protein 2 [Nitrospirae bacterium]|uniref:peptidoglycan D,D-transpeptidase FtsI family protein n=1 Tax=Candidatus Magnetobacterium casense TaxID=1455061 RepID=UPI000A9A006E|nr:penicillin-binding protein 2 [Candidatus Magnetobacterium casensis]MBF0336372.1 penicillin-binding protein 2 [Nitrospirota bacterium]